MDWMDLSLLIRAPIVLASALSLYTHLKCHDVVNVSIVRKDVKGNRRHPPVPTITARKSKNEVENTVSWPIKNLVTGRENLSTTT
jgi:hypothetical protein